MTATLGILLYKNVQPMDIIGPWEVFAFWKKIASTPLNLCLIAEEQGYIECDDQIILKAHYDFVHCPDLDYLLVPGGRGRIDQVNNANLIDFIQQQARKCQYLLSVCTGMFLLQKAGLLTAKSATTYWRALPELAAYPDIKVVESRIVKDGSIWTSGGVSSGIDLAFELINQVAGSEEAGKVQLLFEYFPKHILYCSQQQIKSLPLYRQGQQNNPDLPEYIQNYIAQSA
jgi:transcriptional regulator GlxA family with amidase domain